MKLWRQGHCDLPNAMAAGNALVDYMFGQSGDYVSPYLNSKDKDKQRRWKLVGAMASPMPRECLKGDELNAISVDDDNENLRLWNY